ncbi:Uncharacterised protein at_DN1770 [Pycnogonum litorale]
MLCIFICIMTITFFQVECKPTDALFRVTTDDLSKIYNSLSTINAPNIISCAFRCLKANCHGWRLLAITKECQLFGNTSNGQTHVIDSSATHFYIRAESSSNSGESSTVEMATTTTTTTTTTTEIPTTTTAAPCVQGWKYYPDHSLDGFAFKYQIPDVAVCQQTAINEGRKGIVMHKTDILKCRIHPSTEIVPNINTDAYVYTQCP